MDLTQQQYSFGEDDKLSTIKPEQLQDYLLYKGTSHQNYKYYTDERTIKKILNEDEKYGTLLLADGSYWNDKQDSFLFNSEKGRRNFGISFSMSRSENVAMWMLYGGVNGQGRMINFTQRNLKDIIESVEEFILCEDKPSDISICKRIGIKPQEVCLIDMVYFAEDEKDVNSVYIKRSNDVCKSFEKKKIDNIFTFKKSLPWSYESECRLIISFNTCDIPENIKYVLIKIPENTRNDLKKRIFCSPNSTETNTYKQSRLKGDINWDLCQNCSNKLVSSVSIS